MKKYKKIAIAITLVGILTTGVIVLGKPGSSVANSGTNTKISKEMLAHFKSQNSSITESEIDSIMKQRKQLDGLYKQMEKLELDYGILVDDPNKEPTKSVDDLTAEQRKNHHQLSTKIWDGEIQFLDAQYKVGLIEEDIYKEDKRHYEDKKKKQSE
ncbi:hypothetical protein A6283_23540 [Bacillus wiedmannii]|uniref:hypothetical protein n=1 Tax=Bacillus TaxID=1386 RepID=UPI0007CAD55E|nr:MULTISPECIES: hypothetical protein [Bacillus cereus group]RFB09340.1 hypothetical protein DZB88_26785 [Bacillus sp. OE]OAK29165.1 hypothetical protein A6283_23540 [Bacillus wiedmannii]OAK37751.1 hypothetical protein A6284_25070 [Bacillus wiedmannii]OAK41167.1 hypothetical protein A6285_23850 [Bacillus wiedmannii]OFD51479.1 hypothetical protein BWGOE3_09840 [Bacillus mycoides]